MSTCHHHHHHHLVVHVLLITLLPFVATAFVVPPPQSRAMASRLSLSSSSSSKPDDTIPTTTPKKSNLKNDDDDDVKWLLTDDSMSSKLSSLLDVEKFMDNADAIRANVFAGEFGQRGEVYVVAQVVLGLGVLAGDIPILDTVLAIMGPALFFMGAAVSVLSIQEIGAALSPWPTTVVTDKDGLVTDGLLYGQVRHPIYAGLLACCVGLSLITDSATRLLLTAVFWYVLELKTDFEEEDLTKKFPVEYAKYQQKVPTKFVPLSLIEALPWHGGGEKA